MKKLFTCIMLVVVVVGLSACGKSDEEKAKETQEKIHRAPFVKGGY